MTDLGFGLVDRRSVLIVLFVFILSYAVLNNPLPVDTYSAITTFVSFIILTGFIYLARSVIRVVIASLYFLLRIPFDISEEFRDKKNKEEFSRLKRFFNNLTRGISNSFNNGLLIPIFIKDWSFDNVRGDFYLGILGVLDRAALVGIAYLSTIPKFATSRELMGLIGIAMLIIIYLFSGKFTFILQDALRKAEQEHDELVDATKNPNINIPTDFNDNKRGW